MSRRGNKHRPVRPVRAAGGVGTPAPTPPAAPRPAPSTTDGAGRRPADVPRIRREIADWLGDHGAVHYLQAIETGRQTIRPEPDSPPRMAVRLAAAERRRVVDADLWFVDGDLCQLLAAAYPTMPAWAPVPSDLPSQRGMVVFAEPISHHHQDPDEIRRDLDLWFTMLGIGPADTNPEFAALRDRIVAAGTGIVAVTWGPVQDLRRDVKWPAGGCWMTFYGESFARRERGAHPTFEAAARHLPTATPDNECVFAWYPGDGSGEDPARYHLPDTAETTSRLARMLFATFRLAAQPNLADTSGVERAARHQRRSDERAGLPERDVRIVRLRRQVRDARDAEAPAGAGRDWHHRWIVRGHWRMQAYGPGRELRRPKWIAPHLKGPEGAPMIGGEKVHVI